jgi:hypothetical protein
LDSSFLLLTECLLQEFTPTASSQHLRQTPIVASLFHDPILEPDGVQTIETLSSLVREIEADTERVTRFLARRDRKDASVAVAGVDVQVPRHLPG